MTETSLYGVVMARVVVGHLIQPPAPGRSRGKKVPAMDISGPGQGINNRRKIRPEGPNKIEHRLELGQT